MITPNGKLQMQIRKALASFKTAFYEVVHIVAIKRQTTTKDSCDLSLHIISQKHGKSR